ncbi:MAG: M23 family metallopeptidase, partial [Planctomycetota bacterium]|nr:M23 family metallopeptidase [Planctomycetota bacterium]
MLLALLIPVLLQTGSAPDAGGWGGLGRLEAMRAAPDAGCVSAATRAWIEEQLREYEQRFGPLSQPGSNAPAVTYPFFPMGANHNEDVAVTGFVDLDPAPLNFFDFECGPNTRDGHDGLDAPIRSFEEQWIGVPVFAALAGTVTVVQDGFPDMNLNGSMAPGNFVIVDHGGGRLAHYFHLRNGSVSVAVGQGVRAGQQIGFAASSGNSFYPHLHLSTYDNGVLTEPFAGACRPGGSGWVAQPQILHDFRFLDGSPTWQDLFLLNTPLPWPQPREGDFAKSDGFVYFWYLAQALPPNSTWRHVFERPNGTVAFDSGDIAIGNPLEEHWFNGFWYFWVNDMHTISGRWHWRHVINGIARARVPIEVVTQRTPGFNRPPLPVSLVLDPASPAAGEAVFCRVQGDHLVDDLDYDVLSYRYQWRVNGVIARDVVHAGRADAFPADFAGLGDTLQCAVTVSDGGAQAATVAVAAVLGGASLALAAPLPGAAGVSNSF